MKTTVREARKRLAKAGIELGHVRHERVNSEWKTSFQVTTPIGNETYMESREVVGLLRDLKKLAIPFS